MRIKSISLSEYELVESGLLQVGDVIVVENRFWGNKSLYHIDSVTKTMGKSEGSRFTINVKNVKYLPRDVWDTNVYRVYRKKQS